MNKTRRTVGVGVALLTLAAALVAVLPAATARSNLGATSSTVGPRADFNGDGRGDLVVGVPGEDLGSISNAGGVNVLYGTASGLGSANNQFWSQNSAGIEGTAQQDSAFGQAVVVGDFNGDGFSDLAVSAPYHGVGAMPDAGVVNVLFGSPGGLLASGNELWDQNSPGVKGSAEANNHFGLALAAGDFNDDGFVDLAVGVPGADGKSTPDAGAVSVLYGSAAGLTAKGDQLIHGFSSGDHFGSSLAAGNFNAAGGQDLAIGAPDETNNGSREAGAVLQMLGSAKGLEHLLLTVNTPPNFPNQHCGTSLAAYDWNNDGYPDIAAGCPDGTALGHGQSGTVDIHKGSQTGFYNGVATLFSPDPQTGAEFGESVAAADFGKDTGGLGDDLAVGEPLFDIGAQTDAGRVDIFYSDQESDFQIIRQGLNGTMGKAEAGDLFGAAVTTGNFDGDGWGDLAVGVPGEGLGSKTDGEGVINVLYGSSAGIASSGNRIWSQNSPGVIGVAEPEDFFGDSVAGRTE